jgi:hypothetical protein
VKLTFLGGFVVILSHDFVLELEKQYFSLRVKKLSLSMRCIDDAGGYYLSLLIHLVVKRTLNVEKAHT